ncbi:hypothetical protein [Streptomyces bingchenggensis]|nr:hypothetical protein [Streptomyces bingchenggensis]
MSTRRGDTSTRPAAPPAAGGEAGEGGEADDDRREKATAGV